MRVVILVVALAVTLATMSRGAAAEKYLIDGGVWGWYQQYLRDIGDGKKPGAFAITKDGQAAFYTWCQDIRCAGGTTYSQNALNSCEQEYETECVVFAVRDDIKVDYEVVASASDQGSSVELDPADLAEPTIVSISVSPEIKADIEAYLRNARQGGRASALAIATDGSSVEAVSCPSVGASHGSGPCNQTQGNMHAKVTQEAIKRCGGPSSCVLLYAGTQQQSNIEIIVE